MRFSFRLCYPLGYPEASRLRTLSGRYSMLRALREADLQWSSPMVNGEVGEVLRGARGRASSALGYEHQHPGRQCVFLLVYRNDPRSRNTHDDHLDFIVYVFSDTLPGTEPHQVSVQVAARIQGPDHSDAIASGRGYVSEIH